MTTPHDDWHVYKDLDEAKSCILNYQGNCITHLLKNDDNTYSIMYHIVCEFCDYCAEGGENTAVHKAKDDPYELSHNEENYI